MPIHPNSLANLGPAWTSETAPARKTVGAAIKVWMNHFSTQDLSSQEVAEIYRDEKAPLTKRLAAKRLMRAMEDPDMADYEPVLEGEISLRDLRASGVDTTLVKKMKIREKTTTGEDGGETREVTRELDLHDRSLDEVRTIMDYTEGRPAQQIAVSGAVTIAAVAIEFVGSGLPVGLPSAPEATEALGEPEVDAHAG